MSIARDLASGSGIEAGEVVPHIIPGVLYPAVAGKDLSGTALGGSYTYGTAHTDGRSYYYTDIKGSKPIKDPRIGAHFGSQRYTFRSMQKLEQETATHGEEIFSLDGRENIRVGNFPAGSNYMVNNHWGNFFSSNRAGTFLEITGYFNDINIIIRSYTASSKTLAITVNGVTAHSALDLKSTADSPLNVSRYVSVGMLRNIDITSSSSLSSDTALGINTIKFTMPATDIDFHGIELIAQDTSSTANKSKIQIPSQNVVSYGKKFTVSGTPHYDPFNGFVNDTTLFSSVVDVETSLGLGTATTWGAPWDKGSDDHIRPFNGGRVVKWVDSSGTIKTSVTMMPANAQNVGTTASNEITTASATNSHTINFSDDAIDHSLSEVAKTFHWREFGNGAANGGTGGTYADASMLDGTSDDIAYVMDDGLTSLAGDDVKWGSGQNQFSPVAQDDFYYITFIGTGITLHDSYYGAGMIHLAQNLPYGTHILKVNRGSAAHPAYWVDGVSYGTVSNGSYGNFNEVTFHQPKKPPIPEDAVVLADYMLMADFVAQTSEDVDHVSKGVRLIAPSRDMFYDRSAGSAITNPFAPELGASQFHINVWQGDASGTETRILPVFGDSFCMTFMTNTDTNTSAMPLTAGSAGTTALDNWTLTSGGSGVTSLSAAGSLVCAASAAKGFVCAKAGASVDLGIQQLKSVGTITSGKIHYHRTLGVHTPIHTSSHYQSFETPFLHELVGGDRNMEQTNLVVTPDGKTWDEVTRDTSYLGNIMVLFRGDPSASNDTDNSWGTLTYFEDKRGVHNKLECHQKDWALAYDRMVCLKSGQYRIRYDTSDANGGDAKLGINGAQAMTTLSNGSRNHDAVVVMHNFKRGDYVQIEGPVQNGYYMQFVIEKIGRS